MSNEHCETMTVHEAILSLRAMLLLTPIEKPAPRTTPGRPQPWLTPEEREKTQATLAVLEGRAFTHQKALVIHALAQMPVPS